MASTQWPVQHAASRCVRMPPSYVDLCWLSQPARMRACSRHTCLGNLALVTLLLLHLTMLSCCHAVSCPLRSFGNVFAFGTNLVNSMDRSFLLRVRGNNPNPDEPIQIAKLLDAAESRGMYYVEYSVEKQPGPKRHLYSMVALAYNGRYNRLYTLTAQCLEDQVETAEPVLKAVLKSFLPPAGVA